MVVDFLIYFFVFSISFLSSFFLIKILRKKNVLDFPNQRSNHVTPVPRGGGIAVLLAIIVGYIGSTYNAIPMPTPYILYAMIGLAVVSFIDDIRNINILMRLSIQLICCYFMVEMLFPEFLFFAGVFPPVIDKFFVTILWVGFINAFNFMDGINGISFIETASITIGFILLSFYFQMPNMSTQFAAIILFATSGFVFWNFKNKIFLGDVGSVPLGFVLGFLLLELWQQVSCTFALILPLYYLADTSFTMIKRFINGEKIWQAHSQHFYQRAFRQSKSKKKVLSIILIGNVALISSCFLRNIFLCLAIAFIVVIMQLFFLINLKAYKK